MRKALVLCLFVSLIASLVFADEAQEAKDNSKAADRLEELVRERTGQLQEANDQLVAARDSLEMALDAAQMITWDLDLREDRSGRAPAR